MWNTLIQYWQLTGDDRYNGLSNQALQFLQGEDDRGDFMPVNQTKVLSNDDQSTWALATTYTTEQNVPAPIGIFGGTETIENCTNFSEAHLSYDAGSYIIGAAYVYNILSGDEQATWKAALTAEAAAVAYTNNECPLEWNGSVTNNGTLGGASSAVSYTQGLLVGKAAAPGTISLGNVTGGPSTSTSL
ncbi:uncharacterized protein RAG0_06232 [Rhynchosporium agropyri]|uniref:Mannan endo-1,6-alpha-mannosidase n=1 Tax=Rhynchosporium agropyri TaxID=914238 RepID=A0A1E1KGB6_9HELO|nr:uncharacterized protein RAG0_06232 [Rhynchosporium agropyri]